MLAVLFLTVAAVSSRAVQAWGFHHQHNVLVLHSYHKGFPWTEKVTQGIDSVLRPEWQSVDLVTEYMDAKRVFGEHYFDQLCALYRYKFAPGEFDVIIACDNSALAFLLRCREELFPGVPIVFCGINNFTPSMLAGHTRITGVAEEIDIQETLDLALKLHPSVQEVVVINDATPTGTADRELLNKLMPCYQDAVRFTFLEGLEFEEVLRRVDRLPQTSIILLMTFSRDAAGKVISCEDYRLIADASSVPVYGLWDCDLGNGIVGGKLASGFTQGKTAAEMVLRLLEGASIAALPVVRESPNRYMFDYLEMQRFGIRMQDLPRNCTVINRPSPGVEEHWWWIVGAGAGLLSVIAVLGVNVARRKRAERALVKLNSELEQKVEAWTAALVESEQKFRGFVEQAIDGIVLVDHRGIVVEWNRAMERITGLPGNEVRGRPFREIKSRFSGEQEGMSVPSLCSNEAAEEAFHTGRSPWFYRLIEKDIRCPSGERRTIQETTFPVKTEDGYMIGSIIRDVTETKHTATALRQYEKRFSTAFNASTAMMAIFDAAGRCVDVNDSWLQQMGCTRGEVVGCGFVEINPWAAPEDREKVIQAFQSRQPVRNLHVGFRKRDGEAGAALFSTQTMLLEDEEHVLVVIQDVSEQKLMENEIARLDRLNLVGEMAAGIAHEIRNPMTSVRGFLQMFAEKEANPKNRHYFELMINELDRANAIISEFLSLARTKLVMRRPADLNEIIAAVLPLINADAFTRDVYVRTELNDVPDLLLNEKEIRQLILNLTRNAIEVSPVNGTITIKTFVDSSGEIVLAVQDQGPGIPPEVRPKLGTPFFTTKPDGLGMGLALCYSIARRHGAAITVATGPDGTTFSVRFRPPS